MAALRILVILLCSPIHPFCCRKCFDWMFGVFWSSLQLFSMPDDYPSSWMSRIMSFLNHWLSHCAINVQLLQQIHLSIFQFCINCVLAELCVHRVFPSFCPCLSLPQTWAMNSVRPKSKGQTDSASGLFTPFQLICEWNTPFWILNHLNPTPSSLGLEKNTWWGELLQSSIQKSISNTYLKPVNSLPVNFCRSPLSQHLQIKTWNHFTLLPVNIFNCRTLDPGLNITTLKMTATK